MSKPPLTSQMGRTWGKLLQACLNMFELNSTNSITVDYEMINACRNNLLDKSFVTAASTLVNI